MESEGELIEAVQHTYQEYPKELLNRTWLTLQSVMKSMLEAHGDNNYAMVHMNKEGLQKKDLLPTVLKVTNYAQVFAGVWEPTDDKEFLEYKDFDHWSLSSFSDS
ncbi:hypothetical protein ACA910_003396 [Epithemia clementina (nom. ined.)]